VVGSLDNADFAMRNTFWIGVYPGLSEAMIDYVGQSFAEFIEFARAPLRMAS
jgi:CDP-6-deoxy-D-xylo-4-hexulose-3-dehydrase